MATRLPSSKANEFIQIEEHTVSPYCSCMSATATDSSKSCNYTLLLRYTGGSGRNGA